MEKTAYLTEIFARNATVIRAKPVEDKPTMRLLVKLISNTVWNCLAFQNNKPNFEYIRPQKFNRLFFSNEYDVQYLSVSDDETSQIPNVMLHAAEASDLRSSVVVAAFVTSYATCSCCKLHSSWDLSDWYMWTDCVTAMKGLTYPTLPIGDCLEDLKSEIGEEKSKLFVCGGAKMCAYVTDKGSQVLKVKGLTLNCSNVHVFRCEVPSAC